MTARASLRLAKSDVAPLQRGTGSRLRARFAAVVPPLPAPPAGVAPPAVVVADVSVVA
ncbi:hypothetical protein [Pandoraea communis]|uniref:hypothetical protein n=1 Tax=Pandoraea communis TaxID=2508297 RepID=UPI0025A56C04|nr:hypothetical protein [Pandoraea communis]MDM8355275.1 hypothetical protein [Pandoraea communis]